MLNDVIFVPAENQKINSAGSILIVGGGPTGVELAGEIAVDFPDKKVTLVHNGSRLLEFIGPKAANKTLHWLKSKQVEVKLEQRVNLDSVSEERKTYETSEGEIISADCHFLCTGTPLGSVWLKETMLKNNIDSRGRLMVDENLRVKGRKNIFAIGDITDIPVSANYHTVIIWLCLVFVMGNLFKILVVLHSN
jgi:NADH dehydrogenase FAD-containing subunit